MHQDLVGGLFSIVDWDSRIACSTMKTYGQVMVSLLAVCWLVQCFALLTSGQLTGSYGWGSGGSPGKRTGRYAAGQFSPSVVQTLQDTDIVDFVRVRIKSQLRDSYESLTSCTEHSSSSSTCTEYLWPGVSCLVRCVPMWSGQHCSSSVSSTQAEEVSDRGINSVC